MPANGVAGRVQISVDGEVLHDSEIPASLASSYNGTLTSRIFSMTDHSARLWGLKVWTDDGETLETPSTPPLFEAPVVPAEANASPHKRGAQPFAPA